MQEKSIPYTAFVNKLFNWSDDPSKNFAHAILGIVTEIHEYLCAEDEINGIEELGDITFYAEALCLIVEKDTGKPVEVCDADNFVRLMLDCDQALGGAATVISGLCNTLLDDAKRWIGYGKAPRSLHEVLNTCIDLVAMVNLTGPYPCSDLKRIQEVNMKKLLSRYPGGEFSEFHATMRNLEAERVALQTA